MVELPVAQALPDLNSEVWGLAGVGVVLDEGAGDEFVVHLSKRGISSSAGA
jgi:hypothetical protein